MTLDRQGMLSLEAGSLASTYDRFHALCSQHHACLWIVPKCMASVEFIHQLHPPTELVLASRSKQAFNYVLCLRGQQPR